MTATNSLETLKSQNYSRQSELTAKNQKILEKMFQYIHTFSLDEYQIECIHQDLIGMAQEAELRQESFSEMLGKSPLSFCDDLILASGQISIPAGRRMLQSAGWYYCIVGGIFTFVGGMNLAGLILGALTGSRFWILKFMNGNDNFLTGCQFATLALGILYLAAGVCARRYSTNSAKAGSLINLGFLLLLLQILTLLSIHILQTLSLITTVSSVIPSVRIIFQILEIINFVFAFLYLIGAWKNKEKHS